MTRIMVYYVTMFFLGEILCPVFFMVYALD